MTPEYYGTPSALVQIGGEVSARLVDRPDSAAPLALILTPPGNRAEGWGGVQSLLEQLGVGSLVVGASDGEGAARDAARLLQEMARRRSQPLAIVAVGSTLPLALTLGSEASLADRSLVAIAPTPDVRSSLDQLISRAPRWVRRWVSGRRDERLAAWRGPTLIVRSHDDTRFDAVAANAMAAGAARAKVLVVPGSDFGRAAPHPDQESWRAIADFIRGVVRAQEEITLSPDSLLPSAPISPPPADSQPLPPR